MRNFYNANRKKVRGWKRRIKQLNRWGEEIKIPYLDYFKSKVGAYTYERCTLYPFYMLNKRHPPLWFYKIIISKLVTAYDSWKQVFSDSNIPYDLQLWLYAPAFIRSKIICYRMEKKNQQKTFVWQSGVEKAFPFGKFSLKPYDLTTFEWTSADDAVVIFETDVEDYGYTEKQLLDDGFIRKIQNKTEGYFTKKIGDIWIGRQKSAEPERAKQILQGYFPPPS